MLIESINKKFFFVYFKHRQLVKYLKNKKYTFIKREIGELHKQINRFFKFKNKKRIFYLLNH